MNYIILPAGFTVKWYGYSQKCGLQFKRVGFKLMNINGICSVLNKNYTQSLFSRENEVLNFNSADTYYVQGATTVQTKKSLIRPKGSQ